MFPRPELVRVACRFKAQNRSHGEVQEGIMNSIFYLIGLIVVILVILNLVA